MKKKNKKEIKTKPWQIFSYYIMPFILGIITLFGVMKMLLTTFCNKLVILPDLINEFNEYSMLSLFLSLLCIGMVYLLYYGVYKEKDNDKINFQMINLWHIIIPLASVVMFYFLPNILVFIHNINSILIHNENFKYVYLPIHALISFIILYLIYRKDEHIKRILVNNYSFVFFIFVSAVLFIGWLEYENPYSFIKFILEHRLRTMSLFWCAFLTPHFGHHLECEKKPNYKYKEFLLNIEDLCEVLLIFGGFLFIIEIILACFGEIIPNTTDKISNILVSLITNLNSISYVPVILTTLTIIFIGLAIYKTEKQLKSEK